jgi:hypothetical protein
MRFVIPQGDNRTVSGDVRHDLIDSETGKVAGFIQGRRSSTWDHMPAWQVSLFDDRHRGEFDRLDQCRAFVQGVESAISSLMPEKRNQAC